MVENGGAGILTWYGRQMAHYFTGRHEVPVDEKGRIFVPAEFRKKLPPEADDTLVIVRGFDRCLTAYPQQVWAETAQKLLDLPQTNPEVRAFIRSMLSRATEVKMDRQGRIGIRRDLLKLANIDGQMVIIGVLNKLELWNPDDCEEFPPMEEVADNFDISL